MTTKPEEICLMVQLSEQDAWDLAQFLKNACYAEFLGNAVDDEKEAYRILAAAEKVRGNLVSIGYDPR